MKTRTRSSKPWPDDIPVLVADDLCWNYTIGERRDLQEWAESVFKKDSDFRFFDEACRSLCEVLSERLQTNVTRLGLFLEFAHEHHRPSLARQAAAWNEAMRRLGYEIAKKYCQDLED